MGTDNIKSDDPFTILKISNIKEAISSVTNSPKTRLTSSEIENEKNLEELNSLIQDRKERKAFSSKLFIMLIIFLSSSLGILIMSGFEDYIDFKLSDAVLITLLTTTSANVIGIFLFVVRYLFKANVCHKCGMKITQKQTIEAE